MDDFLNVIKKKIKKINYLGSKFSISIKLLK